MTRLCMALLAWLAAFAPLAATAEPVTLKLSFFASETEVNYARAIKPWIDAVNADPSGAVKIEAYPNGALGKALPAQPQLLLDRVPTSTLNAGDDLDSFRHSRTHRLTPMPSGYAACPAENGAAPHKRLASSL